MMYHISTLPWFLEILKVFRRFFLSSPILSDSREVQLYTQLHIHRSAGYFTVIYKVKLLL